MVDRYNGSASVPTAQIAKPQTSPLAEMASGAHQLAQTAVGEASRRLEERNAALENAALNEARLQLEKEGSQLAVDLQKDRVAGSGYVKDLEAARAPLKQKIWATLPSRIQSSTRAQQAWDDIWTSDQTSSTRSSVIYQAGQEREYAVQSLNNNITAMSARLEADPDIVKQELEGFQKSLPSYGGLLDQETLAKARTTGTRALLQGAVRGLSKQGRFDEATKLVTDAAAQLDPQQRKAFESVIEDAKNDIEREKLKKERELAETQRLAANRYEVDILDGKGSRSALNAKVAAGEISENDKPTLIRAMRAEDDRRRIEAARSKMTEAQKEEWKSWSQSARLSLESSSTMTPAQFMLDPETQWDPQLYEIYQHLTPEDQRALDKKRLDMRETGKTVNEVDRIEAQLIDEAKRIAPQNWRIGSQAKDKTKESIELAGYLRQAAAEMAPETGGEKLTPEQIRSATALAIGRMEAGKNLPVVQWETYAYDLSNSDMTDKTLYADVFERLRKKTGKTPSMAEVRAAYEQAQAALQ
jgi:hypothetical protein